MKQIKMNHLVIKIFKDKQYALNFLEHGQIHFETFKWFRDQAKNDIIEGKEYYRGDPNEGFWFKKEMKFENKYDGEFIVFQDKYHSLASFFTYDVTEIEKQSKEEQKTSLKKYILNKEMLSFGDHAVVILFSEKLNNKLFTQRKRC